MGFDARQFNTEEWLEHEVRNYLQKVCRIYDNDGFLVEEYKTRVTIFPVGTIVAGQASVTAPALYRSFNYDDDGNQIAGLPEMREWTQACEDIAQGGGPGAGPGPGTGGASSKIEVKNVYDEDLVVAGGATVVLATYTVPAGESIYLRYMSGYGDNVARYTAKIDGNIQQRKSGNYLNLNVDLWFNSGDGGILCTEGQVVTLEVTNLRPTTAPYFGSIQYVEA